MPRSPAPTVLSVALSGAAALMIALGVGRFAFTPMLPLMVRDGSLAAAWSPHLAAANYLGYLLGAIMAGRLRMSAARWAQLGLLGVVATTAFMGMTGSLAIWIILRGLAGLFSGWTLVGVSAWVLHELARLRRPGRASLVFAGVGLGIGAAGLFCWSTGPLGIPSGRLWLLLAFGSAALTLVPLSIIRGGPAPAMPTSPASAPAGLAWPIVCYGLFGFGYILPATYLPLLAQRSLDDPRIFGLVWPLFGVASAATVLLAGARWVQAHRLVVWAIAQAIMALGAALPTFVPGLPAIAVSALLIGGTFMIATMLGMQEARARAPDQAIAALGRMTTAFAVGQLAGPLVLALAHDGGLVPSLRLAAAALLVGAAGLLWTGRTSPQVFMASKKS